MTFRAGDKVQHKSGMDCPATVDAVSADGKPGRGGGKCGVATELRY